MTPTPRATLRTGLLAGCTALAGLTPMAVTASAQAQAQAQGGRAQMRGNVTVLADVRTNSVLISGTPDRIQKIKALVAALDG